MIGPAQKHELSIESRRPVEVVQLQCPPSLFRHGNLIMFFGCMDGSDGRELKRSPNGLPFRRLMVAASQSSSNGKVNILWTTPVILRKGCGSATKATSDFVMQGGLCGVSALAFGYRSRCV